MIGADQILHIHGHPVEIQGRQGAMPSGSDSLYQHLGKAPVLRQEPKIEKSNRIHNPCSNLLSYWCDTFSALVSGFIFQELRVIKRESRCPLCGATMTPTNLIDACTELADSELGVLAARCPHCQGHLEMRPGNGQIDLGYCAGNNPVRFDVAQTITVEGLEVIREMNRPGVTIIYAQRRWEFQD
jgi:hypothetical protein